MLQAMGLRTCLALALCSVAGWADMPFLDSVVFEGALEGQPGMVFYPTGKLTLAYHRPTCSLRLTWAGHAVRQPGPQPASGILYSIAGKILHRQRPGSVWSVRKGNRGAVPVAADFLEAYRPQGRLTLVYLLKMPGGQPVRVEETPEFDDHYGDPALRREFTLTGIPAGHRVELLLSGKAPAETWGGGGAGRLEQDREGRWMLVQAQDGSTPLKVSWPVKNSGAYPSNAPVSAP
jgi:hypothetical protein